MAGTKKLNKGEMAMVKVMSDGGRSKYYISKAMKIDYHTVKKYLEVCDSLNDSEVLELVEILKEKEVRDLQIIAGKGRAVLNSYLDAVLRGEKEPNPIAITAIVDRSFQQRRLLEGESTQILNIRNYDKTKQELEKKMQELIELKKGLDYTVETPEKPNIGLEVK